MMKKSVGLTILKMYNLVDGDSFKVFDCMNNQIGVYILKNGVVHNASGDGNGVINIETLVCGLIKENLFIKIMKWKPRVGDTYYILGSTNYGIRKTWKDSIYDLSNYKSGNCFKSKEGAELGKSALIDSLRYSYSKEE